MNNDYGNIEQRKQGHNKLVYELKYLYYFLYAIMAFGLLGILMQNDTYQGAEVDLWDYLIITQDGQDLNPIDMKLYYSIGGTLLFLLWTLFVSTSVLGYKDKIAKLTEEKRSLGFLLPLQLKVAIHVDKVLYYLFFPLSMALLPINPDNNSDKERLFLRLGWLNHLEFSFFKQSIKEENGYERVETLKLFKNYMTLFTKENNPSKAILSPEYRTLLSFFKSSDDLKEIFNITEGYLHSDGGKYDKALSRKEYLNMLNSKFGGELDNFRCYDGYSTVYFSFDLIKDLIDEESERFESYIDRFAITEGGLEFTRSVQEYFDMVKNDDRMIEDLKKLYAPKQIKKDFDLTDKEIVSRSKYMMGLFFRYFAIHYIINQYINLPAGTVVMKMDNYSLRQSAEIYDSKVLVSIVKGKNDGSNMGFRNDGFANMFLLAWNYYNYTVSDPFRERVLRIFNFVNGPLENLDEILVEEKDTQGFVNVVEDALNMEKPEEVKEAEKNGIENNKFLQNIV